MHLLSQAPAFPCGPCMYPMMVSSVHESMILFYNPYSSASRGRNNRSYCFQKDCSSRGRPVYKKESIGDKCASLQQQKFKLQ